MVEDMKKYSIPLFFCEEGVLFFNLFRVAKKWRVLMVTGTVSLIKVCDASSVLLNERFSRL